MGKLHRQAAKSDLLNISLKYGEDKVKFNLYEELVINENQINSELLESPQIYGFLGMLHKKYIRLMEDKEIERKKLHSQAFISYKNDIDPETGKVYSNDMATAYANTDEDYLTATKEYLQAKEHCGVLETCVKSFEQRAFLIQTLSANIRKTN
jgi:hypothetical protein